MSRLHLYQPLYLRLMLLQVVLGWQLLLCAQDSLPGMLDSMEEDQQIATLQQLVISAPEKTFYYLELSKLVRSRDPELAFQYASKARDLAEQDQNPTYAGIAYSRLANIYFTPRLKYDSAWWAIQKAISLLTEQGESEELGRAFNLAGVIHADQGDLENGILYFSKAESVFQTIKDHCWATTIHHNIGKLYKYSDQFDLAKKYFLECLDSFRLHQCPENYDYLFVNLGGMYEEQGDYDQALKYFKEGLQISRHLEHREGIGAGLLMTGKIHRKLRDYDRAESLFYEALSTAEEYQINKLKIAASQELAVLFMATGNFPTAKVFIDSSLTLAIKFDKRNQIATSYDLLHQYYLETGDMKAALDNYKYYVSVKDSMQSEKVQLRIAGLETEKKENQIEILNRENEISLLKLNRSRLYTYLLLAIMVPGILIFYLLFRNHLHRQRVKNMEYKRQSDRKILDMERRILATVIETENRERKRFGIELHDGMGPLLSSVKLYLGEILDSQPKEQKEMVDQAREIIDTAIKNTREIANNIIPSTLNEKGLRNSLAEFCRKIERISGLRFKCAISDLKIGASENINPGLEVVLFRMLTELVNNTVRHADADCIEISVHGNGDHIEINYMDDGRGFAVDEALKSETGMGLKNIKERINSLHGEIKIISEANKGTSIHMKIPF
ncbi:MAG: sensor histidine kinase [Saprospiraceae bacterium]|nr:sensor histidine kinase [Saprospiraceae bacterium]